MKSFRGTTADCLRHLKEAISTQDDFFVRRRMIADFTNVGETTVHKWFRDGILPAGEPLIRLRYYLEFLGYKVTELETLDLQVRDAGRIYSFGLASLLQITERVGYVGSPRNAMDRVIQVFRGVRMLSDEKHDVLKAIVEEYRRDLAEKQRNVPKALVMRQQADQQDTVTVPKNGSENRDAIVVTLGLMIAGLLPIAEYVLSDSFTAAQRERVRQLAADGTGVSRLSHLLTQLSGEAARSALAQTAVRRKQP